MNPSTSTSLKMKTHTIQNEYRCYTTSTRFQCDYTWTIQNFKLFLCQETRSVIKSSTFSAGEGTGTCRWVLELHTPSDSFDFTSLYLKTSNNKTELANFGPITGELRCSIISSSGQKQNIREKGILINPNKYASGFDNFITGTRNIITDGKLFPGGQLTIHCSFSYIQQKSLDHVHSRCNSINSNLPNPMEDFGRLFNNEELSDVMIYVGDGKYPAHKAILAARSSVFRAMFAHDMKENQSNRIDIYDIDENIFQEFLRYLYTGKVQNIKATAFELLLAADKYDLAGLKMICENELCRTLAVENAARLLSFSNNYNLQNLKTRAMQCVKMNLAKMVDSEGWKDLVSQPDLMKIILEE